MRAKNSSFISWICPMLKTIVISPHEFLYYEGDAVNRIYFVKSGFCEFVLPKY